MKRIACILTILLIASPSAFGASITDSLGIIRAFGDQSSWFTCCFVVGDGSWAITSWDAVNEKVGPDTSQPARTPIFISAYTGQAWQCEVRAVNKELNVALIKLPVKGLPAAPLAKIDEFSKAAYGTTGELMSGEPVGNRWPTEIYGITREKSGEGYKLAPGGWSGAKVFVTDMGKYKWAFLSDVEPAAAVPNGSIVVRGSSVVGMYLNRLVITTGAERVTFGRCAMSSEIARFAGDKGVDSASLYNPPSPTVAREAGADNSFQLQARMYSVTASGRLDRALEYAAALVKSRPDDAQAKMVLGVALTGNGKFEEAIKAFDEVAKSDTKLAGLRANRALALVGLKKRDEAEAELLKALEESPSDILSLTTLTDFYFADEKTLDKALAYAKRTAAAASNSPAAKLLVAKVHKRLKDYQSAINEIGAALKLAPDWGEAWYALGATFEEGGDKANAEKAYRKLVEKQPKNPGSLLTLASFLVDQSKTDEALELISRVRGLNPPKEVLDAAQALADRAEGKGE